MKYLDRSPIFSFFYGGATLGVLVYALNSFFCGYFFFTRAIIVSIGPFTKHKYVFT